MKRLLSFDLGERRTATAPGAGLHELASGLAAELEHLKNSELPLPPNKARLTRSGGRCPVHGLLLDFSPWKPHEHYCALCSRSYTGREHDDWWAMSAQLWTVERAVHAAVLFTLRGSEDHALLAERILRELALRYNHWPNRDNVLGPSRPFFSTYLESIWLLNACHALALLEAAGRSAESDRVRELLLEPSSQLIAGFPEGYSNRQVWNEVAVLSTLTLLGNESAIEKRLRGRHSLLSLLDRGLQSDGTWYEGENYHLFAHRGLWFGVEWLKATGRNPGSDLKERFERGFCAPFAGLLPDDTLPSRRDSRYRVSIHQWRLAEYCELGLAAKHDLQLAAVLARIYSHRGDETASATQHSRALSTADVERDDPPGRVTRAGLSWRALLMAPEHAPSAGAGGMSSVCQPQQGLAVIRRKKGVVYAALEGGESAGGHGHPDALALTLQIGNTRLLDDPGTGSYTDPLLHWYRSTLAHHAPLVDGRSQESAPVELLAFEDRGAFGWMRKRSSGVAAGVVLTRTVVVAGGYLVDMLEWESDHSITLTLPVAGEVSCPDVVMWKPVLRTGGDGLEDGFDFARDTEMAIAANASGQSAAEGGLSSARFELAKRLQMTDGGAHESCAVRAWYTASQPLRLVRAMVPSPPLVAADLVSAGEGVGAGAGPASRLGSRLGVSGRTRSDGDGLKAPSLSARHWIELTGSSGRVLGVWTWQDDLRVTLSAGEGARSVVSAGDRVGLVRVITADGTSVRHMPVRDAWRIELQVGKASSSIELRPLLRPLLRLPKDSPPHLRNGPLPRPPERKPGIAAESETDTGPIPAIHRLSGELTFTLGRETYRQTEEPWGSGLGQSPRAVVALRQSESSLILRVSAELLSGTDSPGLAWGSGSDRVMPENPLDNERSDTNVTGLQWYLTVDGKSWLAAGLEVPLVGENGVSGLRRTVLTGGAEEGKPRGSVQSRSLQPDCLWQRTRAGWEMHLSWRLVSLAAYRPDSRESLKLGLQVVVNQAELGRERRKGQLALVNGGGFAYLRGDRELPEAVVWLEVDISGHPDERI